jgi:hypothetical protein
MFVLFFNIFLGEKQRFEKDTLANILSVAKTDRYRFGLSCFALSFSVSHFNKQLLSQVAIFGHALSRSAISILKVVWANFSNSCKTVLAHSNANAWHTCSHLQSSNLAQGFALLTEVCPIL